MCFSSGRRGKGGVALHNQFSVHLSRDYQDMGLEVDGACIRKIDWNIVLVLAAYLSSFAVFSRFAFVTPMTEAL